MALTSRAFADLITFTRASSGTYFDSNGVMQTATTDVPRFNYEYNGSTWVAKGLPIEPAATNLQTYSEDFSAWTHSSTTCTANTTAAPDGQTTADTLTASLTTGYTSRNSSAFTGDGTKSVSIFVKAGTSTATSIQFRDTTAGLARALVTITWAAGVPSLSVVTGTLDRLEDIGGGWYRICLVTTSVTAANTHQWRISPDTVSGTGTVIVWGAQCENSAIATSYIPTAGSTATRAADVALISGANFSSWFNQSAGSVVIYANSPGVGTRVIWQIDDGTANNRYTLYTTGTSLKFDVVAGGVTQASLTLGTITANTTFKAAVAFATNDIAGVLNGGTVQTDASATLPTVDRKRLGADTAGNQLTGHIERDVAYPTRLSDANLQSLTV